MSTPSAAKISKAERRAKQAEFNRQLWEDAYVYFSIYSRLAEIFSSEKPEDNYFLRTQGIVPLKSEFKPAMKVLSRKPATSGADPSSALGQLAIDDEDDEEDSAGKVVLTPEERVQKAQRERDEKQKAYEERRRELFGKSEPPHAAITSTKKESNSRNHSRVKGAQDSRPSSSASNKNRQLYDPNESTKPDSSRMHRKETMPDINQPIREPKAPDGSGRGGFGFAARGARAS